MTNKDRSKRVIKNITVASSGAASISKKEWYSDLKVLDILKKASVCVYKFTSFTSDLLDTAPTLISKDAASSLVKKPNIRNWRKQINE